MVRFAIAFSLACLAAPAFAQDEREASCGYQGAIATAIQTARLDGVRENRVEREILGNSPAWPASFNGAIPTIAGWIYQIDRSQLRSNDLGAIWQEQCVTNWDAIQQMLSNQSG